MDYTEFKEALNLLQRTSYELEQEYIDNGGEVTEDTEILSQQEEALSELLTTDGVDMLGRWLKSKEDEKKAIKAEKDNLDYQMKAIDQTITYIKNLTNRVLIAAKQDKVKGNLGYSFERRISRTTTINKDILNILYKDKIQRLMSEAKIPAYIKVELGASVDAFKEAEEKQELVVGDEMIFDTEEKEAVTFRKPVAKKEKSNG